MSKGLKENMSIVSCQIKTITKDKIYYKKKTLKPTRNYGIENEHTTIKIKIL